MDAVNPYAKMYRLAKVVLKMNNAKTLAIQSVLKPSSDPKRYDLPAVDKVEVVIQGEGILTDKRQIVLHWKQGGLDSISDTHSAYFPLCYRLLFPLGLQQWDNLYQANTTQACLSDSIASFNAEQAAFYVAVGESLLALRGSMFYLDGPGGTGKKFLLNAVIDLCNTSNWNRIVVALSGVASLLLRNGQTAHSTFKIPIPCEQTSQLPLDADTIAGQALSSAHLIIWDEVVMTHMNGVNAVDCFLQRLTGKNTPFGGKVVIFAGDFKHILPVVKHNEYLQFLHATIKSTSLWRSIQQHTLVRNMRLATVLKGEWGEKNRKFASALLKLGEGTSQDNDFGLTRLRHINVQPTSSKSESNERLIDFVYSGLCDSFSCWPEENGAYLMESYILAPLNKDVRVLNDLMCCRLPGPVHWSISIEIPNPDGCDSLPEEVLN
ncbi:hypothetical protein PCANC_24504 [Puccinia coronata f. sp. avenae]|uniref:ATP-dependent DNA helicase n=1 Tax=Puccinia coronata f. sp. avenae TaxID=200324 RepID=A0A2N5TXV0_9BASI|nr:hypothetical protein PCANC_24504 [Puccinia coronata f. sp. avenae]